MWCDIFRGGTASHENSVAHKLPATDIVAAAAGAAGLFRLLHFGQGLSKRAWRCFSACGVDGPDHHHASQGGEAARPAAAGSSAAETFTASRRLAAETSFVVNGAVSSTTGVDVFNPANQDVPGTYSNGRPCGNAISSTAVAVTDNIEFGADYGEGYYVEEIDVTPSGGITLTLRVPFGGVSTGDITHVLTSAAFCGLEPSSFSQNFTNGATASFTAETNTVTLLTLRAEPPIGTYTATLQVVFCPCAAVPAGDPLAGVEYFCAPPITSGASCPAACSDGYEAGTSDAPTAACDKGNWVTAGQCTPKKCTTAPTPVTGVTYSCTPTVTPIATGQPCPAACSDGYEAGTSGGPTATCDKGSWITAGQCTPTPPPTQKGCGKNCACPTKPACVAKAHCSWSKDGKCYVTPAAP